MAHGLETINKMNDIPIPQWKTPAVPRHVIQMLIMDSCGSMLFMHRSNNVRSARNVWSIPTGEHDIGETIQTCAARELHEEYGLDMLNMTILDQYENIAGDEAPPHYHWVISVYGVVVKDITQAINKEPDKHDIMMFVSRDQLTPQFFHEHKFHPTLHDKIKFNILDWTAITASLIS